MAERPTPILTAARGWPHWLAALLFGLLLLLALLIASWFLRACAPIEPSTNLTTLETPALPAPLPPTDPTAALKADLKNKVAQCKPVEPPKPPPPPPVAKAPPPPPLPADRWAQKDLGIL